MAPQQQLQGTVMIMAAAFGFGLNPMFAKVLFAEGLSAEVTSLYRFVIPALMFAAFLPIPRTLLPEAIRMLAMGVANGAAVLCYFEALKDIPAATAILIYYTYPVFSVLIGWAAFRRPPTKNALIAVALVLIAALLSVRVELMPADTLMTALGCFLAPMVYGAQIHYLTAPIQAIPVQQRLAWCMQGHLIVLLPLTIAAAPSQVLPESGLGISAMFGIAIIAAALPQLLFQLGVSRAGPEKATIAGSFELVVAILTGAALWGEQLSWQEVIAIGLILIALCIRQSGGGKLTET